MPARLCRLQTEKKKESTTHKWYDDTRMSTEASLSVFRNGIRMQETANKQKRITLKTVHEMLNGMSVELAEKVHLLFMANYIDYSDYDFRNENQVESYCWCYRDLFELRTKESQEIVNSQLIEFLDEWRQDAPSRYRKAKDDICYWITDEWYRFESPMQKEIGIL